MKPDLRERIYRYNRDRAADKAKGEDLMALLNALPPGQAKNLMKDPTCAAILEKYGITGA